MEVNFVYLSMVFLALIVLSLLVTVIAIYFTSIPYPNLNRSGAEKYFLDPKRGNRQHTFPSLSSPPSIDLSIIVPSYNEEERLPVMLNEAIEFLEGRQKDNRSFSYEIIVVDDGSNDKTSETALTYTERYGSDKVRVMTLEKNKGKGGAVRMGMLVARGRQLLFADADGASKFSDLSKLEVELRRINKHSKNMALVCGSRAHLEKESIAKRTFFRTILMYGFHFVVWFMCVRGIKDTQCGFKLMTREAAYLLFTNLHVERWAFDVDMLFLAQYFKIPLGEVCINWQEIEGSKLVALWSWLQMGKDILLIRLRYLIGAWKINHKPKYE